MHRCQNGHSTQRYKPRYIRPRVVMAIAAVAMVSSCADGRHSSVLATTSTSTRNVWAATTTLALPQRTDAATADALHRLVESSAHSLTNTDVFTLVIFDYVARRYALDALRPARKLAEAATAGAIPDNEPELRLTQASARPTVHSLREANGNASSMLVRNALACDSPGSAPDFAQRLTSAQNDGGYALTHAAVALGIEAELRCPPTGGPQLRAAVIAAIANAVRRDTEIDDIAVERMAMLVYLGAAHRIPRGRIDALVAAVRDDGTVVGSDVATQRHTAGLAIWVLGRFTQPLQEASIVQSR